MGIHNADNSYPAYPLPIHATVFFNCGRFISRLENQAQRVLQIERKLTAAVASERVQPTREQGFHHREVLGSIKVVQPPPNAFGIVLAILPLQGFLVIANLLQFAVCKLDFQDSTPL